MKIITKIFGIVNYLLYICILKIQIMKLTLEEKKYLINHLNTINMKGSCRIVGVYLGKPFYKKVKI